MTWLYERFIRPGKRDIHVSRMLGAWEVRVDGCGQTTAYTNAMWKDAFKRLGQQRVKRILLLGLGAGGSVPLAYRAFPECDIVAVEYDPHMIALARELKLHEPREFPATIEGDAAVVVSTLDGAFDIIIMDLFDGPAPSPLTTDTTFLRHIKRILAPQGIFLANVYKRADYLAEPRRAFAKHTDWIFGGNTLGAFTDA